MGPTTIQTTAIERTTVRAARGRGRLARLRRDERGVAAVEFAVILPLLLGLLTGGIVMWDVFRFADMTERATYTVSDLASRQLVAGNAMMTELHQTHAALLGGRATTVWTRIVSIEVKEVPDTNGNGKSKKTKIVKEVAWGWNSTSGKESTPAVDLSDMPAVGVNDSILLVETKSSKPDFIPTFETGARTYQQRTWIRPRYAASMVWN